MVVGGWGGWIRQSICIHPDEGDAQPVGPELIFPLCANRDGEGADPQGTVSSASDGRLRTSGPLLQYSLVREMWPEHCRPKPTRTFKTGPGRHGGERAMKRTLLSRLLRWPERRKPFRRLLLPPSNRPPWGAATRIIAPPPGIARGV